MTEHGAMQLDVNALNEAGWKLLECGFPAFNKAKDAAEATITCYLNAVAKNSLQSATPANARAVAEHVEALKYIELECRGRPEAVMQKIHALAEHGLGATLPEAPQPAQSVPEAVLDAYAECAKICESEGRQANTLLRSGQSALEAMQRILAARDKLRGKP
jgi:hypothetical protein